MPIQIATFETPRYDKERQVPTRKRRNGEGTFYKDPTKNRWVGEVLLEDALGRPMRRRVSAKTEREAMSKLKDLIARHEAGARSMVPTMTIAEFAEIWIAEVLPSLDLKDATKKHYRYDIHHYVLPIWGHKRLGELRITEVDRGLASLAARGLSRDTVRLAKTMLGKLYKEAIREELVATNPVSNCRMPAVTKTSDRRAMSVEEMEALVSSTVGSRIHGPVVIGLTTGLRPGEILGLRWEDLDLDSTDPALIVRESKTAAGRRTVVLTSYAVEVLKGQRAFNIRNARAAESNGSMWADDGFVFPSITGTKWDISNFRNVFQAACRDAGIGHWRPHELRHSAASWLFANNVHIKVISDQMGHAQISTTADIYGHLIRQPAEVTNAFEKIRPVA